MDDPRRQLHLLYGATFANFLTSGLYLAVIPLFVSGELAGTRAQVGIAVGAFSVSAVVFRPFVGRALDRRGRRPFLLGSLAVMTVSGAGFLVAGSVPAVVALRLLQGAAGGAYYTTAATMATDIAPEAQRASAIARFSVFLYGGFALGPWLGEELAERFGFWAAWTAGGLLAALGLATALRLRESHRTTPAAAPRRARLLHPAALGPGLVLATAAVGFISVTSFSPLYARSVGLARGGLLYTTFAVTVIGVRVISLRLVDRHRRVAIALPGLVLAAAGMATLALVPRPATAFVGVAAFGAGFGLLFPSLMAFTVDRVPAAERGAVLGTYTAFMDIGAGAGGYLVGWVSDRHGFGWGYATPAVLCLGGAVLLAVLGAREPATHRPVTVAPPGEAPAA